MLTKVAVVGAGPVGLLGCLLLQRFNIDFACFQKSDSLRSHPSAHWLSARSKQILSQLNGLPESIDKSQQNFNNFRYYRYCQQVGGNEFGKFDHFSPSIQQKLSESYKYFKQFPSHISQSKLLDLQFQRLQNKSRVIFDQDIKQISKSQGLYQLINSKNQVIARSKYVVLSNGFNSPLRDHLNIGMGGGRQFYKLINIHFRSQQLGQLIKAQNCQAMLHFIYNNKIPCVLVNHSLQQGEFVLQIPNYQPFVDLLSVYTPQQLIQTAIKPQYYERMKKQLNIVHVGRWKLQAQLADRMVQDNIFLAGDTSHTYTPAGGFGMNCGFQDVNQLVHTIHMLERNTKADTGKIKEMYNRDRLTTNAKYLEKSLNNYKLTDQTASELGFPSELTNYFFKFCRLLPQIGLPTGSQFNQKMRLLAMRGLFNRRNVSPKLHLFFDEFDFQVQPLSSMISQIYKSVSDNQIFDAWVDNSVHQSEIDQMFGYLQPSNICRTTLPAGELIVRRDGIVMKQRK